MRARRLSPFLPPQERVRIREVLRASDEPLLVHAETADADGHGTTPRFCHRSSMLLATALREAGDGHHLAVSTTQSRPK
jgi:hypothetical protein